jgi:hypothetical protein
MYDIYCNVVYYFVDNYNIYKAMKLGRGKGTHSHANTRTHIYVYR